MRGWHSFTARHHRNGFHYKKKFANNVFISLSLLACSSSQEIEPTNLIARFGSTPTIHVLHWSAQLGSAEYVKSGTSVQVLEKPFAYELWGLQDESPAVIHETLAEYLANNGWTANTASMGNLMQSELAVSFEWLGLDTESGRFAEIPSFRIGAGLMITTGDPRVKELLSLPREELKKNVSSRTLAVGGNTERFDRRRPPGYHAHKYSRLWQDMD